MYWSKIWRWSINVLKEFPKKGYIIDRKKYEFYPIWSTVPTEFILDTF